MPEPTLVRCPQCGRLADASDRFCGACGATLAKAGDSAPISSTSPKVNADRILEALRSATVGDYDIAGEIGRGGMAVVFLAHDLALSRKVAIKALLPDLLFIEGMERRFKHEARVAAKLDHPNILSIYNVREANSLLYIVMKLVDGLTLSAVLKRTGPLPVPVVRLIVRQAASALAYAHGEGVIHRDVKPANIMIDRKGSVIVMDFGIAKAVDDAQLTQTGLIIGTPAYMSPEQCLARPVTGASDQYSLGLIAYELLTGHTPFRGSALEMQWAHATAQAPPVRDGRPDCPSELADLVDRMLLKQPEQRWPSLHEVADTLGDDFAVETYARRSLLALVSDTREWPISKLPSTPISPVPVVLSDPGRPRTPAAEVPPPDRHTPARPLVVQAPPAEEPPPPPTITVARENVTVELGDSLGLSIELAGVEDTTVVWTSTDTKIVAVDGAGVITAKGLGIAEVHATVGLDRAICVVEVIPTRYVSVGVTPPNASVVVGDEVTFVAEATTTSARTVTDAPVRWHVTAAKVASVNQQGVLVARAAGSTDLIAALEGAEGRAQVTVLPVPVASLRIEPTTLRLEPGKKARIKAEPLDRDGRFLRDRRVEWTASDGGVIEVTPGRVRAVAGGDAAVVVSCEGVTVEIPVAVVPPPPPVPRPPKVRRPVRIPARALGIGALAAATFGTAVWLATRETETAAPPLPPPITVAGAGKAAPATTGAKSSTPAALEPSAINAAATPPEAAAAKNETSPAKNEPPSTPSPTANDVVEIQMPAVEGTLEPGDQVSLKARALNQSRQQVSGAPLAWQSLTPRVAEVSTAGVLRAVAPGTADIVATSGGVRRRLSVVVAPPRARRVIVESRSARVLVGDSVQIAVRALNKSGLAISNVRPQWSAAPSALGTVSDAGVFTGRAPGRALVVASVDGAADTVAIEVERPAPPPAPQPVVAAPPSVTNPTPAAAESGRGKVAAAPLSPDAAIRLFDQLVAAINSRSSERIGQVYTTPADPGDARLWRDFQTFVRNESPRANAESATVQSTGPDASTVVATIGLVWRNNAGIPRPKRLATFTGTATRLPNGEWRLTGIRLQQKVW